MINIWQGEALKQLWLVPDQWCQCCVTSAPYWGLRDYGTAQWKGGSLECDHKPPVKNRNGRDRSGLTGSLDYAECQEPVFKDICAKCGARRIDEQAGLEETPEAYVANMVQVFREVKRVLRDDGTLWLNLGDTYNSGNEIGRHGLSAFAPRQYGNRNTGLKPKDLVGIPWRVAFALQADGWYLRSDIIWHKPNPMPESVTDRPTKSHEYIFLLTKSARYYYDAEAIREPGAEPERQRYERIGGINGAKVRHGEQGMIGASQYRNRRTVWTIATQPYKEAHFATFPEELPKLCILAGTKPGDIVLDPFAGSGTVGKVALELGRKAILIELNEKYIGLAQERTMTTLGFSFGPREELGFEAEPEATYG